jgi:hypothetical protein
MDTITLKKVVIDDLYECIREYIIASNSSISGYSDMTNVILDMIKNGYCFTMDRDLLRDAMESITFMCSPDDDMNKDRLVQQLVDDDSDEEGDEEEDFNNSDMLKMMQMMGSMNPGAGEEVVVTKEEDGVNPTE